MNWDSDLGEKLPFILHIVCLHTFSRTVCFSLGISSSSETIAVDHIRGDPSQLGSIVTTTCHRGLKMCDMAKPLITV